MNYKGLPQVTENPVEDEECENVRAHHWVSV